MFAVALLVLQAAPPQVPATPPGVPIAYPNTGQSAGPAHSVEWINPREGDPGRAASESARNVRYATSPRGRMLLEFSTIDRFEWSGAGARQGRNAHDRLANAETSHGPGHVRIVGDATNCAVGRAYPNLTLKRGTTSHQLEGARVTACSPGSVELRYDLKNVVITSTSTSGDAD